jgi:hypothetical protein
VQFDQVVFGSGLRYTPSIRRAPLFLVPLATGCLCLAACGGSAIHTADFHLRAFPKGIYLVVRSPTSDQLPQLPRGIATATSHARGIRLCVAAAPSNDTILEIRAVPSDGNLGETVCTLLLAKLAREGGLVLRTVTKTEVIGVTNLGSSALYIKLQGPLGNVIDAAHSVRAELAQAGVPTPAGVGPTTVVVSKPQGEQACTLHAGKLTTRLYGSKTLARPLCKTLRTTLADRNSATSRA